MSTSNTYVCDEMIGEGLYGTVVCGTGCDGEQVAIKTFKPDKDDEGGYSYMTLREISNHQRVQHHPHIVSIYDVLYSKRSPKLDVVFKRLPRTLEDVENKPFSEDQLRIFVHDILSALACCHRNGIIHRDVKPANILMTDDGRLQLTDFGLSRRFVQHDRRPKTPTDVCPPLFRPPEIWLGATQYGPAVDVWSVGVIFMLLAAKHVIWDTLEDDIDVENIFNVLGTPTEKTWPGVTELPLYDPSYSDSPLYEQPDKDELRNAMASYLSPDGCDLMVGMLQCNPHERISARDALSHPWLYGVEKL